MPKHIVFRPRHILLWIILSVNLAKGILYIIYIFSFMNITKIYWSKIQKLV